jgi:hypothetical protein
MGTDQGIYPWVNTLVMENLMDRRFRVGRGCFFLGGDICLSVGVYEHVVYVVICYMSVICYMPVMSSSRVLLKKHW